MATLAREILSNGLVMQFSFYDSKKQEYGENIQLCGHGLNCISGITIKRN